MTRESRGNTLATIGAVYDRVRNEFQADHAFGHERRIVEMSTMLDLIVWCLGEKWTKSLSKDYRGDPVYRKNVQRLIERSRKFEEANK
jgi:hypothetical protein